MEDFFEKYQSILAKANESRDAMKKMAEENPELFIKEMGISLNDIDSERLIKAASELSEITIGIDAIFNNKNFINLYNKFNSINDKSQLTQDEAKKLKELGIKAFNKDLKDNQKFCFIENSNCNDIINAHSIQENGELSLIARDGKVIHFIQNIHTKRKEKNEVHIGKASTFKGFCHHHDQIFDPIDKKKAVSELEKYFLYSLRSFAHSYFNIKSFNDYNLNLINQSTQNLNPLISGIKNLASSIGYKLPDELENIEPIRMPEELIESVELERFDKQSQLLKNYVDTRNFEGLDYKVYEINHLCPIVCASWMVMHITWGNGFLIVNNEQKPYYGFPIILSILPDKNKTRIIIARFKTDEGSDLIFNKIESTFNVSNNLELELSKLIIENVENFYLSPAFWDKLEEKDKEILLNAINVDKETFPYNRKEFEILNFFDIKYKLSN